MFDFQRINGLSLGIEYVETEEMGFILCIDLGLFRILWYKDMVEEE